MAPGSVFRQFDPDFEPFPLKYKPSSGVAKPPVKTRRSTSVKRRGSDVANPPVENRRSTTAKRRGAATNPGPQMQISVKSAYHLIPMEVPVKELSKDHRHLVRLTVQPTQTVAALKSMLQPYPWFPPEKLVLLHEGSTAPIDIHDDTCTLAQCGIKDGDTLLACMEGGFTLRVHSLSHHRRFPVKVTSCFQTLAYVKNKLHKLTGFPPEDLILGHPHVPEIRNMADDTPLVSVGLVMPYCEEMPMLEHRLSLCVPEHYKYGVQYC